MHPDALGHLFIEHLGGGNIDIRCRKSCNQRLGVGALAAFGASQDQVRSLQLRRLAAFGVQFAGEDGGEMFGNQLFHEVGQRFPDRPDHHQGFLG